MLNDNLLYKYFTLSCINKMVLHRNNFEDALTVGLLFGGCWYLQISPHPGSFDTFQLWGIHK